ncbi:MAG: calcium-binding protein, partial [Gammaproteobacteria bacterium]|nr:calcium-binding protein [Gammaproteobacteria bacterium]
EGADSLTLWNDATTVDGLGGDDIITGNGIDTTISGGLGNDTITDSGGNDTYIFNQGDGQDTIADYTGTDTLAFGADITKDEIWFSQNGNDLQINLAGSDDQIIIDNWYSGANYQLESIETGSSALLNNQIDQLVSAMASYSVPSGAGNVIPQDVKDALQPILADSWQAA